jgi:NitT/TauT family transport system ATP-binding protein
VSSFLSLHAVGYGLPKWPGLLQDIDLEVPQGEVHCIVGRSGCGKTTLLKLAAGLLAPTQGEVSLRGRAPALALADIGFVFQAPTLLEWQRVIDNVLLPVTLRRRPAGEDLAKAGRLLAQLGLGEYGQRSPRQLSGGQQSRVALARALILGPSLLLMDEPFAALDAITREELQRDLLRMCASEGTTVLFVTHDIAEAVFLADRITLMEAGRIAYRMAVDLPRPRSEAQRTGADFTALCAQLRAAMEPVAEVAA